VRFSIKTTQRDKELLANLQCSGGSHRAPVPDELSIEGQVKSLAFVRNRDSDIGVECGYLCEQGLGLALVRSSGNTVYERHVALDG
jgi:hypothetical protein